MISQQKVRLEKEISDLKNKIDRLESSKRSKEDILHNLHNDPIETIQFMEDQMQKALGESYINR